MFRHYLKTALRNISRNKGYTLINVIGLSLGLTCCILIFLYINDEFSYDTFHLNAERIYSAVYKLNYQGQEITSGAKIPVAPLLREELPEIDNYTRILESGGIVIDGNKPVNEFLTFVDPSFFEIFSFPLTAGDPRQVLERIDAVVITEATARRYFGDRDPRGEVLSIKLGSEFTPFIVTGVARDIPANSSITFSFLLPFRRTTDLMGGGYLESWEYTDAVTYLLAGERLDLPAVNDKINACLAGRERTEIFRYELLPLRSLHLDVSFKHLGAKVSDPANSYVLASLAVLVLLIACLNFTNLSLARLAGRSREVGMRKAIGARKGQLAWQFLLEGVLLSLAALGAGLVLAEIILPRFNSLAGKEIMFRMAGQPEMLALLLGISLVTGLLAGAYPALYLSRLDPADILRSRIRFGGINAITRFLIVVQFSLSIILIIGTLVMFRQIDYCKDRDLGFRDESLISVSLSGEDGGRLYKLFQNEISGSPLVIAAAGTDAPFLGYSKSITMHEPGRAPRSFRHIGIDDKYLQAVGIEIVEGRDFSPEFPSDRERGIIINQTLARRMGWANPLGQEIQFFSGRPPSMVIGVVKDFHLSSMLYEIEPLFFHLLQAEPYRSVYVQFRPGEALPALAFLEKSWKRIAPELPFEYSFLGEEFDRLYSGEERWNAILGYSSLLAVIIACLGLFALSALVVEKRARELCIRKVHGASLFSISSAVGREFLMLILISGIIACPAGYWAMDRWLDKFSYQLKITPLYFLLPVAAAMMVALAAISYNLWKAARMNPAEVLRTE
ncbi:MAG: ABC transporter permease [Candidatus Krumholzibacteriota bacterium]|nr:ABC transporter permease [Candidatus Krumholzibacteriota bacterium]